MTKIKRDYTFLPPLNRLSDNSISGQKHVINKVSKAFKSKKKDFSYYWQ